MGFGGGLVFFPFFPLFCFLFFSVCKFQSWGHNIKGFTLSLHQDVVILKKRITCIKSTFPLLVRNSFRLAIHFTSVRSHTHTHTHTRGITLKKNKTHSSPPYTPPKGNNPSILLHIPVKKTSLFFPYKH